MKFADTQKEKDAKKSGGTPAIATPSLQNTVSLASTLQQVNFDIELIFVGHIYQIY